MKDRQQWIKRLKELNKEPVPITNHKRPKKPIELTIEEKRERWKNSEEGKWMQKHCSRQYYETLSELNNNRIKGVVDSIYPI